MCAWMFVFIYITVVQLLSGINACRLMQVYGDFSVHFLVQVIEVFEKYSKSILWM